LPGQEVGLKWPNDVVVAGGKICGLLLEARDGAVVIGTGVNIAPVTAVPGAKLPAISLQDLGDAAATPAMLAEAYATRLLAGAASWERDGFSAVRLEWLRHCAHIGARMKVTTGGAGSDVAIEGDFVDLGIDGALVLRDDTGAERRITTGDVELTGRL
jgi:BirA family biotin operon repressor/biotin-[acetyl-CoA-carboxylase] ligase